VTDPAGPSQGARYRALLTNAPYARLFYAGLGSVAGSSIAGVCLTWYVFAHTRSALDVGLLGTFGVLGSLLLSVLGGAWADRYDRRRLMIVSDVFRGGALAVVVALLVLRGFDLVPLLAVSFVLAAFSAVFGPAEQALVPALVAPSLVADANGLVRSSRSTLQFVGASLGGVLLVTVGPVAALGVNGLTFLLSAGLLVGMQVPLRGPPSTSAPRTRYTDEIRAGFRWLWTARGFFQLTLSATVFNFCSAVVGTFLVVFSDEVLHGSALVFALLLAAEVAGSAVGALLVGPTRAVRWAGRAWVVPYGSMSALVALLLVLVPAVPVALGALFALGVLGGFAGTAWLTAAQMLVPSEMQGRYFGIDNLGSVAIIPAAQIGGAVLIAADGIRTTYLAAALVWLVAGVVFLLPRALARVGYEAPPVTPRSADGAPGTSGSPGGTRGG